MRLAPADSHLDYNSVCLFEEQSRVVEDDVLRSLGAILKKHDCHGSFGISLLHRHNYLPAGHVMAHSTIEPDTDICRVEPLGRRPLYPSSYHLSAENVFVPFEYTDTPAPVPEEVMLAELTSFFREHNLEHRLAVSSLPPTCSPSVEKLLQDGTGTITTKLNNEADFELLDGTVTEWAFIFDGDDLQVRALRKCTQNRAGGHEVTPDDDETT